MIKPDDDWTAARGLDGQRAIGTMGTRMLGRLLHRRLGVGAEVTVLAGPYAGHSGRITDVASDGSLTVFIDDCCQPVVSPADVSRNRSTSFGDRVDAADRIIHENPEFERTRTMAKRRSFLGWWTRGV